MARFGVQSGVLALGVALGGTFAQRAHATLPRDPMCTAWTIAPQAEQFLKAAPLEGFVILPLERTYGPATTPSGTFVDPSVTVEVGDADGQPIPGSVSLSAERVGDGVDTGVVHLLWTSSRSLVPGAHYELVADVQNILECGLEAPFVATFDVEVAEEPLTERLKEEPAPLDEASLEWWRMGVVPQCCVARSTEHCADPEHCFACVKSVVRTQVVVPHTPENASAYLSHDVVVSDGAREVVYGTMPLSEEATEVAIQVRNCASEYCVRWRATAPLTGDIVESEHFCLPGTEPRIEPASDGALMLPDNPCADGSGTGVFMNAAPPTCDWYPEVLWFESEEEGLVALGVDPATAAAQAQQHAKAGAGGTGGTSGLAGAPARGGTGGATSAKAPGSGLSGTGSRSSGCAFVGFRAGSGSAASIAALLATAFVLRRLRPRRTRR